tara:strand:+ start:143 stop:439 length:297 start_codon:yes stop_codon:yes gene_type:complete
LKTLSIDREIDIPAKFGRPRDFALSAKGEYFALISPSGGLQTKIFIMKPEDSLTIKELTGHASGLRNVEFAPNSNKLFSGSDDWTVRQWDVEKAFTEE